MRKQLQFFKQFIFSIIILGLLFLSGCNMPSVENSDQANGTGVQPTAANSLPTPASRDEEMPQPISEPISPTDIPQPTSIAALPDAESIFGASIAPLDNTGGLQQVVAAKLRWTRADLVWAHVEPSRGDRNWGNIALFEQNLREASLSGINVVLILNETPAWAIKPGFSCGAILEDYFDDFAGFAKEAVERYSQPPYNVRYWEVYNEPDAPGFLGCWGDPTDTEFFGGGYYGKALQKVYPAMKSANPDAQVFVGGLLMDCDPVNPPVIQSDSGMKKDCTPGKFFEGVLASGATDAFDGVAFHSYDYYGGYGNYSNANWNSSRLTNGSSAVNKAAYLRSLMEKYGVKDRYLINTEFALFCGNEGSAGCDPYLGEVEATKAYYIVQFMANSMAEQYRAAIWYSVIGGRNNSLINADNSPKPALIAMEFTNSLIGPAHYTQTFRDQFFTVHEFQRGNQKIWAIWTNDNLPHSLELPWMPNVIYKFGPDGHAYETEITQKVDLDVAPALIVFQNP